MVRLADIALTIVGAALAFLIAAAFIVNLFYFGGAYFLDAGWFSFITWHADPLLASPPVHPDGASSYFTRHVSFMLLAVNALSFAAPGDHIFYFAVWMALLFVAGFLVGRSVFDAGLSGFRIAPLLRSLAATGFGLAFAFSGIGLATLFFPHPEIAIPFAIVACLFAWMRGRTRLAILFACLAIAARGDAGLHLALILAAAAAGRKLDAGAGKEPVQLLILAGACLAVSAGLFLVQGVLFPGGGQLAAIYLGDPPFSHITPGLLGERLRTYATGNSYVFAGFLGCLAAFALTRRWIMLCGALAGLPWLALGLLANSDIAGAFTGYYAFPFVVQLVWPLVWTRADETQGRRVIALAASAGAVLISIGLALGPGPYGRIVRDVWPKAGFDGLARIKSELAALADGLPKAGTLVDPAVASIVGDHLPNGTFYLRDRRVPFDAIVYYPGFLEAPFIEAEARAQGLSTRCTLPDAPVQMLTSSPAKADIARRAGFACAPD